MTEVVGQVGVTGFQEGVVEGEGAVFAVVESVGELVDGGGPASRFGIRV